MKIIEEYKNYLSSNNKSYKTIQTYTYDLEDFFKFICAIKKTKRISNIILFNIEQKDIIQYFIFLMVEKGNTVATRSYKMTVINRFYKWLLIDNPEIENPTEGLEPLKRLKKIPKVLNLAQAKELQNIYTDKRNNLIIKILLQTGLRLNELSNIKISKIDFDNKTMKVIGKGNKDRIVFLNEKITYEIKNYVNSSSREYLFEGNSNGHISNRMVEYIVENAYRKLGLTGYTTHSLRHTCATILYNQTKDILLIQKILGHDTLLSTQIYIHVVAENVKNCVNSNPLNNIKIQKSRRVM